MVRKGEILSQALSDVSDELLDGARELFEKSEEDVGNAQELFYKKRQAVKRKMIYAMSTVAAAACILIVLGVGITTLSKKRAVPEIYYNGIVLDEKGVTAQAQDESAVVSYSLEREAVRGEAEFALHIKARGSFTIEASSGEFMPDGTKVISADDEADVLWSVEPCEDAYLTVNAGTYSVEVKLHLDGETGEWLLMTQQGND